MPRDVTEADWVLLTNDDGVDSPALVPFARALSLHHPIRIVVPDRERSWVGKAITRHEPVTVQPVVRDGIEVLTCSGYPADAAQLGVHTLFEAPPTLVVSGINTGYNHGAGFLMSSGTVGAAVEAWVSGIRSIAFSTGTMTDWPAWREYVHGPEAGPGWERTATFVAGILRDIVASGLLEHADVVSVNLPFDPPPDVERRLTRIARVGYDRLFRAEGDGRFVHGFGGGLRHFADEEGTDVDAAHDGAVSITPILMPQAAVIPEYIRRGLETP